MSLLTGSNKPTYGCGLKMEYVCSVKLLDMSSLIHVLETFSNYKMISKY